jgi:hypothetical protein
MLAPLRRTTAAEGRHNAAMTDPLVLAEDVRQACIASALAAYEDAGVLGLCAEGRWEAAVSAMQSLDLRLLAGNGPRSSDAGADTPA